MNPETINLLREMAQKLGTTVEHLWPVMVARARVDAVMTVSLCAVVIVATLMAAYKINKWADEQDMEGFAIFSLFIVAIIIVSTVVLFSNIPAVVNPESEVVLKLLGKS